jgi:hypothetical protein
MSFEGYYQLLCKEGHYYTADAYFHELGDSPCPVCEAGVAWENLVDTTNVETEGYVELIPTGEIDHLTCWECEGTGIRKERKFIIPEKELDN